MFTGIVSGVGIAVAAVAAHEDLISLSIEAPIGFTEGISKGASVSVSGICLTLVSCEENRMRFDVMGETITRTTIKTISIGSSVNLERSATSSSEIGGHVVSGHVEGVAQISAVQKTETNCVMTFSVPDHLMKFIFSKGFVALDGCSLTVVNPDYKNNTFDVWFIPETLRATTFGIKSVGDAVNIETDYQTRVIVETVERVLAQKNI